MIKSHVDALCRAHQSYPRVRNGNGVVQTCLWLNLSHSLLFVPTTHFCQYYEGVLPIHPIKHFGQFLQSQVYQISRCAQKKNDINKVCLKNKFYNNEDVCLHHEVCVWKETKG